MCNPWQGGKYFSDHAYMFIYRLMEYVSTIKYYMYINALDSLLQISAQAKRIKKFER